MRDTALSNIPVKVEDEEDVGRTPNDRLTNQPLVTCPEPRAVFLIGDDSHQRDARHSRFTVKTEEPQRLRVKFGLKHVFSLILRKFRLFRVSITPSQNHSRPSSSNVLMSEA